jgi:hypothetical protein
MKSIAWGGYLVAVIAAICAAGAQGQRKPVEPPIVAVADGVALFRVDSPRIHDADTLSDATIRLPWGVAITGRSIRADFDACEVSRVRQTVKIDDAELVRGKAARDELGELLKTHALYISLPERDIDPYDRIDSVWWLRSADGSFQRLVKVAKERKWLR